MADDSLSLAEDEAHVWITPLDLPDPAAASLAGRLDSAEAARAARFRFDRDRRAYTVARATLRLLLGRYLCEPAESLVFAYGAQGKPALSGADAGRIHFNVSHSDALGVFAFARAVEVGVDVEKIRSQPDLEDLAERFFSGQETAALSRLPAEARTRAFYRCWTAKEAYIKGVGEGLSMPLDRFAVSLEPADGAVRLRILDGARPGGAWRIHRFEPRPGYVGALAVAGRSLRIFFREWPSNGT